MPTSTNPLAERDRVSGEHAVWGLPTTVVTVAVDSGMKYLSAALYAHPDAKGDVPRSGS